MHVRTDDEVYRIDAVWLGPPRATFPWRARYVSYGVGLLIMMIIMFLQRRLGIPLDFFSVAWSVVGTVAITRLLGKKITYERPFGQVVSQFWAEVVGPRARTAVGGGAVHAEHVRVRSTRGGSTGSRRKPAGRAVPATASTPASAGAPTPLTQTAERGARAFPARTTPPASAWASRQTRTATAESSARGRRKKEARRGRA